MKPASKSGQAKVRAKVKVKAKVKAKAKVKVKARSAATKPRKSATKSESPSKVGATAKPALRDAGDWRGQTLSRMRALILEADPEMIEERKWRKPSNGMAGVPVWSHHGIVCTGETYKQAVKLTFAQGAKLPDPARLFNASLEGGTRRAIDIAEGARVNVSAFKALVKSAVALNATTKKK